jgi:predicted MFS family arabinose efflux permease
MKIALGSLTLGNFAIGAGAMVMPGMLLEMSRDLQVSPAAVGLLISAFAMAVCIGGPFLSGWTSRIERRTLLTASLILYAVTHLAAALAPGYQSLLVIRVLTAIGAGLFTAQAAATVGLMVPPEQRGKAMGTIFLGWSISAVVGTPMGAYLSALIGWRWTISLVGFLSAGAAIWVWRQIPGKLFVSRIDRAAWKSLFTNTALLVVLSVTAVQAVGMFSLMAYMTVVLKESIAASPALMSAIFLCFGGAGVTGNVIGVRFMDRLGPVKVGLISLGCMLTALVLWPLTHGSVAVTAVLVIVWGLGCFAMNSSQQVRLVMMSPALAPASVSLNSSSIYLGQALGAFIGGLIISTYGPANLSYFSALPMALAIGLSLLGASMFSRRMVAAPCGS